MRISFYLERLLLAISHPFMKTYRANVCGHSTKKEGVCVSFGEKYTINMPLSENENPDHCLKCIGDMAIKCAWCGEPIYIGEPITLYSPERESFKIPEYAVRYSEKPVILVGCLRWDCALTGGDRAGFWMPPGKVLRVTSPIEMALSSGKGVVVQNLSDPSDLGKLF